MAMTADFVAQRQQLIDLCIQIQQVAAPTGMEGDRARWVADWLRRCGYADVVVDEFDNVYACLEGEQRRPAVLVSAHIDTVFPAGTDLSVRYDEHQRRIYGPGLGDNSMGVAAMLEAADLVVAGKHKEVVQDENAASYEGWFRANVA